MKKVIYEKYEELQPRWKYISDLNETFVCEGLCATHIDETQYKDISSEKAEEILEKGNEEEPEIIETGDY